MKRLLLLAGLICLISRASDPQPYVGSWSLFYSYSIFEPWVNFSWSYNGFSGNYVEHTASVTSQSSADNAPVLFVTQKDTDDEWHHFDHVAPNNQQLILFYALDTFHWANAAQSAPGYYHYNRNNWSGSVVQSTDYNYIGVGIQTTPLRQANFGPRPVQQSGYQPNTTETGIMDGRQYFKTFSAVACTVTLHLDSTSVDSTTGMQYAPHFYRIHTSNAQNVTGVSTTAFNDSTRTVTFTAQPNVWYEITPSYVSNPSRYDFTYSISIASVEPK